VISQDLLGVVEQEFGAGISSAGRPRLPVRLMVSLMYLKNSMNLSDEELDALTEIAFAWVLLGAARHCHRLSTLSDHGGFPREFLQEKIESYLFFSRNILPHTITRLGIVCDDEATI